MITSVMDLKINSKPYYALRVTHLFPLESYSLCSIIFIYMINYKNLGNLAVSVGIVIYDKKGASPFGYTTETKLNDSSAFEAVRELSSEVHKRISIAHGIKKADYIFPYIFSKKIQSYLKNDVHNMLCNSLFKQIGL